MPTVNIYFRKVENQKRLQGLTPDLKKYLAEELTCGDITLSPSEISIRFLNIAGGEMSADIELEITAHAFHERIGKQDEICLRVMDYIKRESGIENVRVWLKLSNLGHSW